jgi:hypothetical protein
MHAYIYICRYRSGLRVCIVADSPASSRVVCFRASLSTLRVFFAGIA